MKNKFRINFINNKKYLILKNKLLKLKQTLYTAKKNESDYREIIDKSNLFIFKCDSEGNILFKNDYTVNFFNEISQAPIPKNLFSIASLIGIEAYPDTKEFLTNLFNHKTNISSFVSYYKKNNNIYIQWDVISSFSDNDIKITILIGTDITMRKRNELLILNHQKTINKNIQQLKILNEELRQSNNALTSSLKAKRQSDIQFEQMSQSIPFGVFISKADGSNKFVNNRYAELTGLKNDEALGSGWIKGVHPDDLEEVIKRWAKAVKRKPLNFNMIYRIINLRTKKELKVHTIAKEMIYQGELIGYVGIIEDITKQERLITKLKYYEQIIRNSSELMSLIANDGRYLVVNDSYVRAHGIKKYNIEGKTFSELWGQDIYAEKIKLYFETALLGKVVRYQDWFHYKQLGEKFMDVIYQPVFGNKGEVEAIAVNTLDITDLKRTQLRLEKAIKEARKANKAKSEFLANMSHEIRTPLNAIIGFSELVESQIDDKKQLKYLKSIKAGGKNLLTLINDILDLSKIEAGKMDLHYEEVNLKNLLSEINQIFFLKITDKNLQFANLIDDGFPRQILLDEIRLRQILFNLVGNAIKFTEKGMVKIETKILKLEDHFIDFEIIVSDTGIGIPFEQQKEIFRAFRQQTSQNSRKYGGTGLGLTISKKLCEAMGGKIEIESEVGKFSRFTVTFNKIEIIKTATKNIEQNLQFRYGFKPAKILVIDNVQENCNLIIEIFLETPITVLSAQNINLATKIIHEERPQLIILDLNLRNKKDCKLSNLFDYIKANCNIPVIASSTENISQENCKEDFIFTDFLEVPIDRNILLDKVANILKHEKTPVEKIKHGTEEQDFFSYLKKHSNYQLIKYELENNFREIWEKAKQDELSDDIEKFSNELLDFAKKYELVYLINFAQNLIDSINSFDLTDINISLNKFSDIINKI